ncbi:MAG: undecaprenyl-diphosphate phosphatase [Thermoplasmata archaeon]|nr:undecaprenyl-diphosphate phosphatase [Thermoplasmata archaeon]
MDWLTAVILGIIQGIAEWLPISSSGHFIVAQHLLQQEIPFSFNIGLHFATMLVITIFFWREILKILKTLLAILSDVVHGTGLRKSVTKTPERKYAALLLLSVIPTGIIGIIVDLYIIDLYIKTLLPVGIAFIIQGLLNLSTKFGKGGRKQSQMNLGDALAIGTMQGLSSFSGLSRSGSTIAVGVARGLRREDAARFSFIASLPAFLGATLLEIREITGMNGAIDIQVMLIGGLTAFIVGLLSLKLLMWILRGKKFYLFSLYSFGFAVFVLGLFLSGL